MSDKYDGAVTFLKKHPGQILSAFSFPDKHRAGCLFKFCTASGRIEFKHCGCPVLIRKCTGNAATERLTNLIRADDRIPPSSSMITLESLPAFADVQRLCDRELGRK
jgi:hypothetical protein